VFASQSAVKPASSLHSSTSSRMRTSTRRSLVAASSRVAWHERRACDNVCPRNSEHQSIRSLGSSELASRYEGHGRRGRQAGIPRWDWPIRRARIKDLKNRFLGSQVHNEQMTPEKSMYDLAKGRLRRRDGCASGALSMCRTDHRVLKARVLLQSLWPGQAQPGRRDSPRERDRGPAPRGADGRGVGLNGLSANFRSNSSGSAGRSIFTLQAQLRLVARVQALQAVQAAKLPERQSAPPRSRCGADFARVATGSRSNASADTLNVRDCWPP
jgi:hypothetical protein